jgi:hypothetical protein
MDGLAERHWRPLELEVNHVDDDESERTRWPKGNGDPREQRTKRIVTPGPNERVSRKVRETLQPVAWLPTCRRL